MQNLKSLSYPKYWGYWLLLCVLYLLSLLPFALRMAIGGAIGRVALYFAKHRQAVVKINLRLAFPNLDDKAQAILYRQCAKSMGQGFIETAMAWFWSEKALRHISRLEADPDSLAKVRDPNTPVILVGSHSTLLELGVRLLGIYEDSAGMYRPLKNPFFETWIKYQRGRAATELVHFKDMRHVLRLLQNGSNLWYALDQDGGRRISVFAPFFGIPAASANILPKLKERTGACWIPVFIWREGKEYVVKILPEIPSYENDSDSDVMTRVNAIYEAQIKAHPEQYFWVHRRFKNRENPEDDSFYPSR